MGTQKTCIRRSPPVIKDLKLQGTCKLLWQQYRYVNITHLKNLKALLKAWSWRRLDGILNVCPYPVILLLWQKWQKAVPPIHFEIPSTTKRYGGVFGGEFEHCSQCSVEDLRNYALRNSKWRKKKGLEPTKCNHLVVSQYAKPPKKLCLGTTMLHN